MNSFQKLFRFYIVGSLHVALACTALAQLTIYQINGGYDSLFLVFIFCIATVGYNFVKYTPLLSYKSFNGTQNLQLIMGISLLLGILAVYLGQAFSLKTCLSIIPFLILTFFYVFPLSGKFRNLRNLPGIKIFIVATVWTGITYVVPFFHLDEFYKFSVFELLKRFILMLVLMIPFEIRDVAEDDLYLKTLPQNLGIKVSKRIGYLLLCLFLGIGYFQFINEGNVIFPDILVSVLLAGILVMTKEKQSGYFSSFWVEAIPILYVVLYMVIF